MSENFPSRRSLLKRAATIGTIAALAAPAGAFPKSDAAELRDAELLRLGAEFEREHVILAELDMEVERLKSTFETEQKRLGIREWDAVNALREETGYEEGLTRLSDHLDRMDALTSVIRSIPAQTFAGLAVKVRVAAFDCHFSLSFNLPPDQIDWQEGCFLQLVREVERMAREGAHV